MEIVEHDRPVGNENNIFAENIIWDLINGKGFDHELRQRSLIDDRDDKDKHEGACWVEDISKIEWLRHH